MSRGFIKKNECFIKRGKKAALIFKYGGRGQTKKQSFLMLFCRIFQNSRFRAKKRKNAQKNAKKLIKKSHLY
jgi:hypothetical protein